MDNNFSFKDFEKVRLKATSTIEINNRIIDPGETIAVFDSIQIARLNDNSEVVSANGGFNNQGRVFWTTTKDQRLDFLQGVFSPTQFALMNNANLIIKSANDGVEVTMEEELESNREGKITLAHAPTGRMWIYNKETGAKITNYVVNNRTIIISNAYLDVVVVYTYQYTNGAKLYRLGQPLIDGFVSLEGRTRVKDDVTGQVTTGIFKIPKLKLMSNLSIQLGTQASPVVGSFSAIACPVGSKGDSYISELYLLNDDIESDL